MPRKATRSVVPTQPDDLPAVSLSVGAAAARLGVAPETVRSWGRRYGLTPSGRTAGGHRRFAAEDLERLSRMQRLVAEGASPADAARRVLAEPNAAPSGLPADASSGTRGGPGGRVLAVPGASRQARGLARAASRLDADGMDRILGQLLTERGTIPAWDVAIRPVLVAAGEHWMATGEGIEIEHMLSESVMAACWRHRQLQQPAVPGRPVLLACYPDDIHVLPLHVLAAALAEHRVPTRQLGARVPMQALLAATRRTGASAVFVWRQIPVRTRAVVLSLPPSRPPVRLVLGGPGWAGATLDPDATLALDLRGAVDILRAAATA